MMMMMIWPDKKGPMMVMGTLAIIPTQLEMEEVMAKMRMTRMKMMFQIAPM